MTDPNTLMLRFHKKNVIREDENTIMVKIDDSKEFMGLLLVALHNPDMAVVRRDEE